MGISIYKTSDFHTCIVLSTLGFKLVAIDKTNPKRFVFQFEANPEIHNKIDLFFRGELRLDPRIVLIQEKLIKQRIYGG